MAEYNFLADANRTTTNWRFKVKVLRVFSYFITGVGRYWSYVLADENRTKMEMCITPSQAPTFEGLEKEEGNWIEIDQVELILRLGGCKISESSYMISLIERTRIRKINPINNKHFMDFVHIDSIRHRSRQTDVAIDSFGVIHRTLPLQVEVVDPAMTQKVFYERDVRGNSIRCVAYGTLAYTFEKRFYACTGDFVIVVLKMWRIKRYGSDDDDCWLESLEGLSDLFLNPGIDEADELRDELDYDPYVAKDRPSRNR